MTHPCDKTLSRLEAVVGARYATRDPAEMGGRLTEWRGKYTGATPLLVRPATTDEVAGLVRICTETQTPLVPQGGNTGLVGGQIPQKGEVLLSLERLNAIRALDADNNTLTVEAGCILADIHAAAEAAGRRYPLSLASEGSARIGGLLSTMPAASTCCAMGRPAAMCWGWRWCWEAERSGMGLKVFIRTIPGTI